MDRKPLPIGVDSFRKLREGNYYYIDKSMMIADWLTDSAEVTLITRPRRFGKTLNMDMVKEFFDIDTDSKSIFEGLAIMDTPWKEQLNSQPVIFLSFRNCKDIKPNMMKLLKEEIRREYERFEPACRALTGSKQDEYKKIMESLMSGDVDWLPINSSIAFLTQAVSLHYNKNPLLLIDEYDTPMTSAYSEGYYEDMRSFFTAIYATALKGNTFLDKALLTGIQRIAKENIFSGLNNLKVCTVADSKYAQYFGFDETEANAIMRANGLQLDASVKEMYDGYRFGGKEVYNPWSLLNYADDGTLLPYWVNTSSNALIRKCILEADDIFMENFDELIADGYTNVSVLLDTSFFELSDNDTRWGLLLNAGYITLENRMDLLSGFCQVRIPNFEVKREFREIVAQRTQLGHSRLNKMFYYLVQEKNIPKFMRVYQEIVTTATSYYDAKENAYHMLMLGMCVYLDRDYEVTSNLEAGLGRSDITLKAKRPGLCHIVMEFKQGEELEQLAGDAVKQIKDRQYCAGLAGDILLMGIAHRKKECVIRTEIVQVK